MLLVINDEIIDSSFEHVLTKNDGDNSKGFGYNVFVLLKELPEENIPILARHLHNITRIHVSYKTKDGDTRPKISFYSDFHKIAEWKAVEDVYAVVISDAKTLYPVYSIATLQMTNRGGVV